jgi:D-alanyl-D-alanine carboxypeptidase
MYAGFDWGKFIRKLLPAIFRSDTRRRCREARTFVDTFRIEDPASYARNAFVQTLARAGVIVRSPTTANNAPEKLPERSWYSNEMRVAELVSPPYSEYAKLILKVSLNLGANLSLTLFGLTEGNGQFAARSPRNGYAR